MQEATTKGIYDFHSIFYDATFGRLVKRRIAGAIAHILETRRRQRGQKPPMPLALPDRPGVRDLDLTPHPLESYDDLTRSDPDDPE